ncbi:MAG: TolC family protein [Myxococcales bacterium]|nr:TolC family protein [Myxococcales bacterium]
MARGGEILPLSLADAMAMAIQNNLNVEIARHDPLIAWERNRTAWGAYDPTARLETGLSTIETPVASALQANTRTEDEVFGNSFSISGILPAISTQYGITLDADRTKTNRSISSLREQWDSGLTFSITQPLLRGLYWNEPWTEVKVSKQFYRQSLDDFNRALMDIVRGVEEAYWNLVATDEQERVAEKSLEAARELLEQTEVQYEVGVVSKVEVVEAEAGVAERDVELIRARNNHERAEDQLIDRVMGAGLTAGSLLGVNPTDRPDDYTDISVDVEEASRKAMERRPELASIDRQIEQRELQLTFARNQLAPQIDLVASYGYQGLAGKTGRRCTPAEIAAGNTFFCQVAPIDIHSNYRHSIEDYFDHDGAVNWSVGGVLSIPLGNHAPRARRRSAEIELRKTRTQRTRQVQDIVLEIRNAARDLKSAQEGIEAAERRRLAAEEQFRAEGIRLEQGESTPFDVLQRERDLVEAESQKINAYQVYRNSVVSLERAQGTILDRHNIVVEDARRLR